MRSDQIEQKIQEAIMLGRGDKQAAVRVLTTMCEREPALMIELVRPFLAGILLHAIERVLKRMGPADLRSPPKSAPPKTKLPSSTKPQDVPKDMLDKLVDVLGQNIPVGKPRVKAGDPVSQIGIGPGDIPPPDAGPRHQRAIQTMASSFKWKDK